MIILITLIYKFKDLKKTARFRKLKKSTYEFPSIQGENLLYKILMWGHYSEHYSGL